MTRRRYVQIDGELVEVDPDYTPEPPRHDAILWNDRQYQDANDPRFNSRSTHREYMKRNGLTTVDDFSGQFQRAAKARGEFFQGKDSTRRADIERALERHRG